MNTRLLVIDPQNDFLDIPGAALPVAGANADMQRLATWVQANGAQIDGITVTLDSHPGVAVERTTFWKDVEGNAPAPFTLVTPADVRDGRFMVRDESQTAAVVEMLEALVAQGKPGLVVWPVHCVTGTWGHNIQSDLALALQSWEFKRQRAVRKVLKGEYPLTEHFGVFEADVPVQGVESTQFNTALARSLTDGVDLLLIAGEASSHCVAASFDQLMRYRATCNAVQPRIVVLRDAMSPVGGFEAAEQAFFERAEKAGAQLMTLAQATDVLAQA